ncbi:MAG: NAD(P)-dependent oxidoreductase [Burkholderiales bacterium]
MGPIGVLGLGLIGSALSRRLRDRGVPVIGYDRDTAKISALEAIGVTGGRSPADVASRATQVIIAVFDTSQLEDVVEGRDGIVHARPKPRTVLSVVTGEPRRVAALAQRLTSHAIDLLETPLSGSSGQVQRGEATMFVGGRADTTQLESGLLDVLATKWHHVGEVGMAGRTKLATNLILGLNRAALAEGLVFAKAVGLDPAKFLALVKGSAAYSQVMNIKGDRMLSGDFAPEGRIIQHAKDVGLIVAEAAAYGQRLPLSETHAALLADVIAAGEGDLDNAAIIRAIERARKEST